MPRAAAKVAHEKRFYKLGGRTRAYEGAYVRASLRAREEGTVYLRETTVACASAGGRHCVSICTDFREGASRRLDSNPLTYGLTSA
jgi:hypothetical protein